MQGLCLMLNMVRVAEKDMAVKVDSVKRKQVEAKRGQKLKAEVKRKRIDPPNFGNLETDFDSTGVVE